MNRRRGRRLEDPMSGSLHYRGHKFEIVEGEVRHVEPGNSARPSHVWLNPTQGPEAVLYLDSAIPVRPGHNLRALGVWSGGGLGVARVYVRELGQTYDDRTPIGFVSNPIEKLLLVLLVPLSIVLILVGCFAFGFGHGLLGIGCFAAVAAAFYFSLVRPPRRFRRWRDQAMPA